MTNKGQLGEGRSQVRYAEKEEKQEGIWTIARSLCSANCITDCRRDRERWLWHWSPPQNAALLWLLLQRIPRESSRRRRERKKKHLSRTNPKDTPPGTSITWKPTRNQKHIKNFYVTEQYSSEMSSSRKQGKNQELLQTGRIWGDTTISKVGS